MRRAIKEKVNGILDNSRASFNAGESVSHDQQRRPMTDRVVGFVRERGAALASTVQEHVTSVTDTTGTLAKQKLLQTLFSSGVVQSEHVRRALQIGIGYFLDRQPCAFDASSTYIQRQKFPALGGITPPHSQPDFDIEAHGLDVFAGLMHIYGINAETLKAHICHGELKEIVNPSSSGSLLYLTSDSTYLVKTVRDYDAKFIQNKFLQEYYQHVRQRPDTFLSKLFGVFGYIPYLSQQRGITVDSFTLRFAVVANFIPINLEIHEKYDLKGSSYRRDANIDERLKSSTTFKDNDFRDLHPTGFEVPPQIYQHLRQVLTQDVDFLERLNIMDYSLLLTVHNIDNPVKVTRPGSLEALMGTLRDKMLVGMSQQKEQNSRDASRLPRPLLRLKKPLESFGFIYEEVPTFDMDFAREYGGIPAVNEKGERVLLFIGIIDILQTFDICKVMQRQYQTVENRDVVAERSIVEADFYARRFKEFLFERVFHSADHAPSSYPMPSMVPPLYSMDTSDRSSVSSLYPRLGFS